MKAKKQTPFNCSEQYRRECEVRYFMKKMGSNAIVAWAIKKGDVYLKTLASELLKVSRVTELDRRVNGLQKRDHLMKFKPFVEAAKIEKEGQREDQRLRLRSSVADLPTTRREVA